MEQKRNKGADLKEIVKIASTKYKRICNACGSITIFGFAIAL
ncbi:MAG TPA: hypothetical protein VE544_01570 [Nitrososphaeraceae archaeon]|nr:hypothetical protein [Nitrososphaeraceae archaeon]